MSLDGWERKVERLISLGDEYAEARANLENLKNTKATVLAVAGHESGETSAAGQSAAAARSESYRQWCLEFAAAFRECERLRLRLEAGKLWLEVARTVESSRREEMRLAR